MSDLEFTISGIIPATGKEQFLAAILAAMEDQPSVPQIPQGKYVVKAGAPIAETTTTIEMACHLVTASDAEQTRYGVSIEPEYLKIKLATGNYALFATAKDGTYVVGGLYKNELHADETVTVTQEQYDTFFSVFEAIS